MAINPTLLGLYADWTGCEEYRLHIPFRRLREKGWNAFLHNVNQWTADRMRVDIFVMGRLFFNEEERAITMMDLVRHQGGRFVYETDDDLSNQWRVTQKGDWGNVLSKADAVTVTNAHLAKVVAEHNPNVHIIPNHVDMRNHIGHKRQDPRLTVGLQGGPSHYDDWKPIEKPLRRLKEEFPEVRFKLMGYMPEYLQGIFDEFTDFQRYRTYVQELAEFDIGLCPLDSTDPFNNSKTPIKALEYWATQRRVGDKDGGIAVVASDHVVYRRAVSKGNGILVRDDQWYDAIRHLIINEQQRRQFQIKGHRWVKKNANIEMGWRKWALAYRTILRDSGLVNS